MWGPPGPADVDVAALGRRRMWMWMWRLAGRGGFKCWLAARRAARSAGENFAISNPFGHLGAASAALHEQRHKVEVHVAASCVAPLVDAVLCKDVSEVDAEEYQRACMVLTRLCWMGQEVAVELTRNGRFSATWAASGNAPNAVAAKDPAELTREVSLGSSFLRLLQSCSNDEECHLRT